MKKLQLVLVALLVSFVSIAQNTVEDKVWQKVTALNKAIFETKDSDVLNELLSDKVSYGHSGGNVEDKQLMIKNAVENTMTYKGISEEKVDMKLHANTAIVRHVFRATTLDKGTEGTLNLHVLQVWGKEKGKWKLLARQSVRVNPK